MTKLTDSQAESHKEKMEFEKERDRAFLEFKKEEAERNRRHELEIAKIFASSMNSSQQQRDFRYTAFDQTSLFQHSIQHAANFHVTSPTSQLASPSCHFLNIIMQLRPSGHPTSFLTFSGDIEREHWAEMG